MSTVLKARVGFAMALAAAAGVAVVVLLGNGFEPGGVQRAVYAQESSVKLPVESPPDVAPDVAAARKAVEQKQYREAQRYLERALAHIPGHKEAVFLLVRTADLQTRELFGQEKYLEAAHRLAMTGAYVQQFAAARVEGGAEAGSMAEVLQVETALEKMDSRLRHSVAGSARKRLVEAERLANDAYRYFWFNSRGTVRKGLRQAQWVQQHFDYLDPSLQGEFFRVLNLLQGRVSNSEWQPLLAEAGMFELKSN